MDLAFYDGRIDPRAAIVKGVETADLGNAGIDIDIDYADIGAERIGHVRRIVVTHRLQPRLHAGRDLVVGGEGDLGHGLLPLRHALHAEAVDVPFEDRKSTRLNSSYDQISYAVFCLKKKKDIH